MNYASVATVVPKGYVHAAALTEMTETVLCGLKRLGYDTDGMTFATGDEGRTIVIGAHLLATNAQIPNDAIIYNSEHISSSWINDVAKTYYSRLRQHDVWDYSADNAKRLSELLGKPVNHVPLGYVPELTRIKPAPEQDIDVLFYGSINPRRETILKQLHDAGLKVEHAFGVYGKERDQLIARAKVVLNLHFYLPGHFEIVRVSYLMANKKAVVVETNADEDIDADLAEGVMAVPYEHLVDVCHLLVKDADIRHKLEETALNVFSARNMSEILAQNFKPASKIVTDEVKSLALVMIVKDELSVITRALDSVQPLIDYVLVCDTGSTDGTQKIIENWLIEYNVPGQVIEEPWKSFGYNRSHVLAKLREIRPDIDYAFMLDADEVIELSDNVTEIKQRLKVDCYNVDMRLGTTAYALPRVTSNRMPFYYRGPVHEWPDCKEKFHTGHLPGITIKEMTGGARENNPNTYRRDAELFEAELKRTDLDELEHRRYTFYLAQSLRDCGEPERALEAYTKRLDMGGWHEEIYVSLLNIARMQEKLQHPVGEVVKTYRRAIAHNPRRAEAIHGAVRALRNAEMYHEAYVLAEPNIKLPLHVGLFVETWIYDHGLLDEFAVCGYYAGHQAMCWLASELILCKSQSLDEVTRKRIAVNADFARRA